MKEIIPTTNIPVKRSLFLLININYRLEMKLIEIIIALKLNYMKLILYQAIS